MEKVNRILEDGLNQAFYGMRRASTLLQTLIEAYLSCDIDEKFTNDRNKAVCYAGYFEALQDGTAGILQLLQDTIRDADEVIKEIEKPEGNRNVID